MFLQATKTFKKNNFVCDDAFDDDAGATDDSDDGAPYVPLNPTCPTRKCGHMCHIMLKFEENVVTCATSVEVSQILSCVSAEG